ncbi:MAG TPA: malectin domain-containing carbohydrate-binding protein, partial [Candidatus Anoxymicrobiaceae bacterium]
MRTKLVRTSFLAGLVLIAACGALLLTASASAASTGVGQPIVELQQNAANELTYPSTFVNQKIAGTNSGGKQQYKFQRQREGKNFVYVIANLTPNTNYSVELSFVEREFSAAGQRVFNVYVQAALKLSRLDIYRMVGKYAAYQATFIGRSNATGALGVTFRSDQGGGRDYATVSTVRVYAGSTNYVEVDASVSRLTASIPVRLAATSSRNTYETVLSRLGSRFCLNLAPQKLSSRMSPLGDGTGDLQDLVLALSNGSTIRSMPFTDRYPVWENVTQSQTMTSQTFGGWSSSMPFSVSTKFTAPFYPQDDKISGAPFIYMDVTVKNNSASTASPSFIVARPQRQDFASSAVAEFPTATVSGMQATSKYSYYDESLNPGKSHSAVEALAVPANEAGDVDFRGSIADEFGNFSQGQLWGYVSPSGYPSTYNDYKHPIYSFYPRGYTGAVWSIAGLAPGETRTK